jgi:hypothetical protein
MSELTGVLLVEKKHIHGSKWVVDLFIWLVVWNMNG